MPLQEDLAALVPDGRLVVAEQSGHFIPGDQPDLVIAAIAAGGRGGARSEHLGHRILPPRHPVALRRRRPRQRAARS